MRLKPASPAPHGADLTPGENLLICGLRAWAAARCAGEAPHRPVSQALIQRTNPRVAALFLAWIQAVEASRLRPICAECCECGGAAPDLQRLVVACGVAPVAFELGEKLIAPLVSDPQQVMILARSLNAALARAGWPLPARLGAPSEPGEAHRTIH
ncbi:hypothetical protein [Phenylobacterium sp.]|uniref:hypothetical protein n=1 Tax=Phenylobacterium sp. TaxID=1871053 RepID=UPI0025FCFFD7|nr:hypothetical protein [Phenylobacterium sp.]